MTNPRRGQKATRTDAPAQSEETMTAQTYQPEVLASVSDRAYEGTGLVAVGRTFRFARPLSPVPTIIGMLVAAVGLLLIGIAWNQVAAEADVSRQVPYLLSGGIFGLALVLLGALIINVASKRRETALREQQTRLLSAALDELGRVLGSNDPNRR